MYSKYMLQPKFSLTTKLLTDITTIERLYGQIEAMKIPKKLELHLERHNLVKSSYASNKIEGNPLTLPEVTNLLLDDRMPVNRDEKEVKNYFDILSDMDKHTGEINLTTTTTFHKRLMQGVDKSAGEIRNTMVVIGKYNTEKGNVSLKVKHEPPFHKKTEIIMELQELYDWQRNESSLPVVIKAGIFHHQFVYIHPFEDGNGRVCRLLTALIFINNNYRINKYFVLDDYYDVDKHEYSDNLHSADNGDKTLWLEYFAEGVKYSLQSAISRVKNSLDSLSVEEKPSPRERQVLDFIRIHREVTSADIAKNLKVTRQQAHNLLKGLLEKGLIDKKGSTKSSYYFIK